MNFFEATVHDHGAARVADISGLGRQAISTCAKARGDGSRVLIAIRPESLSLSQTRPDDAPGAVAGRVQARQYLGGRQLLHIAVDGRDAPVAVSAAASRGEDPWEGSEGRPVWLSWGPDAMTVLDPD
jgi:ABC-type Fe3+/spermidine/putrescine transport system ATPase subunit